MSRNDVGGLTFTIFRLYQFTGKLFFTLLIGKSRATRESLEGDCVLLGGILIGLLLGFASWMFSLPFPISAAPTWTWIPILAVISFLLASIVLGYTQAVDKEIAREAQEKERAAQRAEKVRKIDQRTKQLIAAKMSPQDARKQALEEHGEHGGGCFIATVCFGDDAPEVVTLRAWRDQNLAPTVIGRLVIRAYYRHSPSVASTLGGHAYLRAIARCAIRLVIGGIERSRLRR